MKKTKIEDMEVRITYSNKKINRDKLYKIFCDIIDREIAKDEQEEGDNNEKEYMFN